MALCCAPSTHYHPFTPPPHTHTTTNTTTPVTNLTTHHHYPCFHPTSLSPPFSPPPPASPSKTVLPGAGCVLASLQARAKLAAGVEQVEVVGAHKVLREADDGGLQARLAVVVGRVLRHVASQLGNLGGVFVFMCFVGWEGGERVGGGGEQGRGR